MIVSCRDPDEGPPCYKSLKQKRRKKMTKRIVAIMLIFAAASVAWMFLGVKTSSRTNELDNKLKGAVMGLWGKAQTQDAPRITYIYKQESRQKETILGKDNKVVSEKIRLEIVDTCNELDLASSDLDVSLNLNNKNHLVNFTK
jgi:hypothetical protein